MIAPDNPERTGYKFYGWTLELKEIPDIFVFNESTFFTENITLYAIWIINQYTITFDSTGGSSVSSIIQNYGTAITAPSDPTRTGYTFNGWDTEIPATMPAGDLTVTATWGVNQYTITFDSTGGSSVSSIIQNYGTAITAPSDPTRTGYTFNGWDTEIPATMPAKDLTITAKWTINQYTITWKWMDENGAEIATTESFSYGATPNKTVEGYKTVSKVFTFKAWDSEIETVSGDKTYTATYDSVAREYIINWIVEGIIVQTVEVPYGTVPEYTGVTPTKTATAEFTYTFYKWTPAAVAVTGNADYTAIFTEEINKYTITFDSAGGSAVNPITKNYNTDVTLPDLNSTTRTGHTFKGWSLTDNGETLTAHTLTEDVILYAVWEINQYTITFNSAGGSAVSSITQNYDTVIETPNNPTRTGYTFVGWDTEIPTKMPATNMTVTAVWMINQYIISFDENGADGTIPVTIIKKYDTSIDLPDVGNLIKIGHSFTGWAFDVDGDTVVYEAGATFNIPASNVRFIAVWTINQYTITFDSAGGTDVDPIEQDYGTSVTAPADPTREGFVFMGWNQTVPEIMPAENLDFLAIWEYPIVGGKEGMWNKPLNEFTVTVEADYSKFTGLKIDGNPVDESNYSVVSGSTVVTLNLDYLWTLGDGKYNIDILFDDGNASMILTVFADAKILKIKELDTLLAKYDESDYGEIYWTALLEYVMSAKEEISNLDDIEKVENYEIDVVEGNCDDVKTLAEIKKSFLDALQSEITKLNDTDGIHVTLVDENITVKIKDNVSISVVFNAASEMVNALKNIVGNDSTLTINGQEFTLYDDGLLPALVIAILNETTPEDFLEKGDPVSVGYAANVVYEDANITLDGCLNFKAVGTREMLLITLQTKIDELNKTEGINVILNVEDAAVDIAVEFDDNVPIPVVLNAASNLVEILKKIVDPEESTLKLGSSDKTFTLLDEGLLPALVVALLADTTPEEFLLNKLEVSTDYIASLLHKDEYIPLEGKLSFKVIETTCEVIFKDYNGNVLKEETVIYREGATPPNNPDNKKGYRFIGWDTSYDCILTDLVITAQYEICQYTVTFYTDGGSEVDSITEDYDTSVEGPDNPVRDGYIFYGWYISEGEEVTFPFNMPVGGLNLTAMWKIGISVPVGKELTYNGVNQLGADGGTGYTLETGKNQTNVGDYTVTATLNDGYLWVIPGENGDDMYSIEPQVISWSIVKTKLTVTADNVTVIFGNEPVYTVTYTGLVGDDSESALGGKLTFNTGYDADSNVYKETYVITPSGLTSTNYDIEFIPGTLTVNKIKIDVPAAISDLIYNGSEQTGVTEGTGYNLTGNYKGIDAGNYTATATLVNGYTWIVSEGDDADEDKTIGWSIGQVKLTVTAGNETIIFGDDEPTYGVTYSGFVEGENQNNVTFVGVLVFTTGYDKSNYVAALNITPSGLTSANYDIEFISGTLTVNKIKIDVPAAITDLIYNGSEQTGVTEGTGYTLTCNYKGTDADNYVATVTLISGYKWNNVSEETELTFKTIEWTISPASLTVTANDAEVIFRSEVPEGTLDATFSGFVNNENKSVLGGMLTFDTGYNANSDVYNKTYTIKPFGLTSTNYEIDFISGTLTVNKKAIGIPAAVTNLVYNGSEQTGVLEGEGYTLAGNYKGTDAGNYVATVTLVNGYKWIVSEGDDADEDKTIGWSIGQVKLTVTAGDKTIIFGDDEPTYGVTYSGFVEGENQNNVTFVGVLVFTTGYDKSNYVAALNITPSGLTSANYDIEFISGTLTVNKIKIDVPAAITDLIYNGSEQTGVTEGTGYTLTCNYKGTDADNYVATVTLVKGYIWIIPGENGGENTYTADPQEINWSIGQKNIAGAVVTLDGTSLVYTGFAIKPGVTSVTLDGKILVAGTEYTVSHGENINVVTGGSVVVTGEGNYTGTVTATFVITKEKLTLPAENTTPFIYTGKEQTYDISGFDSDTMGIENNTRTEAGFQIVIVSIKDKANYEWADETDADVEFMFTISPKELDISKEFGLVAVDRVYNGNDAEFIFVFRDTVLDYTLLVDTDYTVTVTGVNGIRDVGTVTVTVTSVDGSNYSVSATKEINITPKIIELDLTGENTSKIYDGKVAVFDFEFNVNYPTYILKENTDYTIEFLRGGYGTTDFLNVGTITVNIKPVGGSNYSVSGTMSFTIFKAELTATYAGETVEYGTSPGLLVTVTGFVNGENETVAGYAAPSLINVNVNAGKYQLAPSGGEADNYTFKYVEGQLEITKVKLDKPTADPTDFVYTGNVQTYNPIGFVESTMGIENNTRTDAGSQTVAVSIKDKTNYRWADKTEDDVTFTFTMGKRNISDVTITINPNANLTYTGLVIEPGITVTLGGDLFDASNYSVSYENNINAGTATVKITAKGTNYDGTATKDFVISKAKLTATYAGESVEYGTIPGLVVTVTGFVNDENAGNAMGYDAPRLTNSNVNVGEYQLTPSDGAANNYSFDYDTGTLSITKKKVNVLIGTGQTAEYTGAAPAINYKLSETVDTTVTGTLSIGEIYNVGIHDILIGTLDAGSNYELVMPKTTVTFEIIPKNISGATVGAIPDQTYTGSAIIPDIVVKDGSKILTADTDYKVSFAGGIDNTNVGNVSVTVTGIGNYKGTVDGVMFSIIQKNISDVNVTVTFTDGVYNVTAVDGGRTLEEDVDYEVETAGNPLVKITVKGKGNYTGEVSFEIYTISFVDENGNTIADICNLQKDDVVTLENPSREGYEFTGWYFDSEGEEVTGDNLWTFVNKAINNVITLTAVFEPCKYTITFDSAGGSAVDSITQDYMSEVNAPGNPVKTGYDFVHWKDSDGNETTIPTTMPLGGMILTAVWNINQYTVTLVYGNGEDNKIIKQDYGTAISEEPNPVKTGHTFTGWDAEIPAKMPATDMTITAIWNINQYTVTLVYGNGEDNKIIKQDYGTAISEEPNPVKTGHTFKGWDIVIPENMPAENLTVTAQWTINQYTITFDTDGGSSVDSIKQDYGTAISAPGNPTKEGHTFAGWYPIVPATMSAKNFTITALWTVNQYTMELNPAEGFVIEDGDGSYTVKGSYTDNSTVKDVINEILSVSIYCNDTGISDVFDISYYDMNGNEIFVLDLSKGGTTFMIRLKATPDSNEHSSFGCWVIFKYGSVTIGKESNDYLTIEDALQAKSGDMIIVRYNTSFADEDVALQVYGKTVFEVGSGVTLLLPYDENLSEDFRDTTASTTQLKRDDTYVRLNVSESVSIDIFGTLTVNAKRNGTGQPFQNYICGNNYSELVLNENSLINIEHGGMLNAIGFIYGEGMINASSGATVRDTMLLSGWRGGTVSNALKSVMFPFEQFAMINIETDLKINSGATYESHLSVYAGGSYTKTDIVIIGNDTSGMLKLSDGFILKQFDCITGNLTLELNGNASLQNISMYGISSKGLNLPFDGRWHVIVKDGSCLDVKADVSLLPGSSLVIENGAVVNIERTLTVFNPYEYIHAGNSFNVYPMVSGKIHTSDYYRTEPTFEYTNDTPAKLEVYGTLNVMGGIAGRVDEKEGGVLNIDDNADTSYQITYIVKTVKDSNGDASTVTREVRLWTFEPYSISITVDKPGDDEDAIVTVLVIDKNGQPVSNKTVVFKLSNSYLGEWNTDDDGYVSITISNPTNNTIVSVAVDDIEATGTVIVPTSHSCIAAGTLITLADGTQKPVEELTGDELLLVWNMNTGTFDVAPIIFIDSDPYAEYEIIHLYFSDGTDVKVIYEHGFWDFDLNRYVYINDDCPQQYVGHWFNKQTADADGNFAWTKVQLVDVVIHTEYTTAWSPVTAEHLCYYTNGMLSMPGGIAGLFNIFEIDPETMEIDQEAYLADIAEYGLFTYEEFLEILDVPEEIFDIFQAKYFKVAIGKGLLDADRLMELITRYGGILGVE